MLKLLQYILKFIAAIFYKIAAQHTYTKLWKYFMKHKFLSLIYKPLKYLFTNFIYLIELASEIIAVFSLFNKVIKVINYIKKNIMK